MMREILFRGKRVDNSEWVYGCLLNNTYGASKPVIISDSSYTDDNRVVNDDWEFVIPETVGQYTGLTDKNGNKIFEGDILKLLSFKLYKVYFDRSESRFQMTGYDDEHSFYKCVSFCEIVGNIHDNPKLTDNGWEMR